MSSIQIRQQVINYDAQIQKYSYIYKIPNGSIFLLEIKNTTEADPEGLVNFM